MPYMRIRDGRGIEYQLRTRNPELLAMWFLETIEKLDVGPASWNQIFIEPDWEYDENGKSIPDWPSKERMNFERIPNGLTDIDRGRWFVEKMNHYFNELEERTNNRVEIPRISRD